MSSGALVAYNALLATLTTPAMTAVPTVHTNLIAALERGQLPAVVVEMGDEPAPNEEGRTIGFVDRELAVEVTVLVDSATPYTAADDAAVETFDRIVADRTLGGTCLHLFEAETTRQRDDAGVGRITKTYRVVYRTQRDSLLTGD